VTAEDEHRRVGELTRELGIDRVHVVGEDARGIVSGNPDATWSASRAEVADLVHHNVSGDEVVLVKASRGAALEQVAQQIVQMLVGDDGEEPSE
jgi:UDP-N-acetylmuramoyl-tripeptide--D-alanyl-D-alanine ligase